MEDVSDEESGDKFCSRCRKLVPLKNFHKDSRNQDGHKYLCKSCTKEDARKRYKKRKIEAEKKGVCIRFSCPHKVHEESTLCPDHFYKTVALNTLKDRVLWRDLEHLAKKQDYICPLTGDKLIAGVNMSLDHIKPVSRFPELQTKLTNLQWITKWANTAKNNLDLEEFVANCLKVTNICISSQK